MLGAGILSLGLGVFFFWVMMNGDNVITAHDWKDAVDQVGQAFGSWVAGKPAPASGNGASPTPNQNTQPNTNPSPNDGGYNNAWGGF